MSGIYYSLYVKLGYVVWSFVGDISICVRGGVLGFMDRQVVSSSCFRHLTAIIDDFMN